MALDPDAKLDFEYFTMAVSRVEKSLHTFAMQTKSDHSLTGWRLLESLLGPFRPNHRRDGSYEQEFPRLAGVVRGASDEVPVDRELA